MKRKMCFLFVILLLGMMSPCILESDFVVPLVIDSKISVDQKNLTLEKLRFVGINSVKIAQAVELASKQSGLSTDLLIALMYTESEGNVMAVSCKGYKGLMQIPDAVFYPDANMLIGAHIFNEKMKITKRNVKKALCLYKGYPIGSKRGEKKAHQVLVLKNKLEKVELIKNKPSIFVGVIYNKNRRS